MRNAEAYIKQGRNDPRDPEQKREHPYDFVSFPKSGKKTVYDKRFEHIKEAGQTGKLTFKIEAKTAIHIGSGIYQLSEDAGFNPGGQVVRGIVISDGKPIIPGSSLKGACRSTYESITRSCLRIYDKRQREKIHPVQKESKLPAVFLKDFSRINPQYGSNIDVELSNNEIRPVDTCEEIKYTSDLKNKLCPACALFGSMGYQGRLVFGDAKIVTAVEKDNPIAIPSLTNPQMHRVGEINVKYGKVIMEKLEGRKFYYKSDYVPGTQKNGNELIDYIPAGSVLEFEMFFKNSSHEELGGILYSFAVGEDFTYRLGGGKPVGLGEVKIELLNVEFHNNRGRESFLNFTGNNEIIENIPSWINDTKGKFRKSDFYYGEGLDQLRKIVNTLQDINTI